MQCKICKDETYVLDDKKRNKEYFVCPQCDYISLDEKYIISSEEEKRRYSLHNNTFDNQDLDRKIAPILNQFLSPDYEVPKWDLILPSRKIITRN